MDTNKNLTDYRANYLFRFLAMVFLLILISPLRSQEIDIPKIRTISLDSTNVEIIWEKSAHPAVLAYEIKYAKFTGNNPMPSWVDIDIVDSSISSYSFEASILTDVNPYEAPVAFCVVAFVNESEKSKFDGLDWDSTMFLQTTFDTCLAQVNLNWTPYDFNMWTYDTKEYVIMISENDNPFTVYDRVPESSTSFRINDLLANNIYRFYIGAVADTSRNDTSTSQIVEINTEMARLPDYIYADYATNAGDNAEVSFSIDPLSEIQTYELLRSNSIAGEYSVVTRLEVENNKIIHTDAIDYNVGPYFYKLDAINFCDEHIRSSENVASTIVLNLTGEPLIPELSWNAYQNWMNGVCYYQVDRRIGNEPYAMLTTTNSTEFTDNTLLQMVETGMPAQVCYRITAFENDNPYGENAESFSNEFCAELPVNIRFEYDAFVPGQEAGNNTFGPKMDFLPDEIEFSIVDRGGQVVFNTTNPENLLWDGTYNGQFVTQGAYMYVVKYSVGRGKRKIIRGGLVVAYP